MVEMPKVDVIHDRIASQCRNHAQWDTQKRRKRQSQDAQPGRIAKAAVPKWLVLRRLEQDILHHHAALPVGRSQVAAQCPADIAEKLAIQRIAALCVDPQRLVQAELLVQHLLRGGVHLTPVEIAIPRPAGRDVHQGKGDQRHKEEDRDSPEKAADDVLSHRHPPTIRSNHQTITKSGRRRPGAGHFVTSRLRDGAAYYPRSTTESSYLRLLLRHHRLVDVDGQRLLIPDQPKSCGVVTMPVTHGLTR